MGSQGNPLDQLDVEGQSQAQPREGSQGRVVESPATPEASAPFIKGHSWNENHIRGRSEGRLSGRLSNTPCSWNEFSQRADLTEFHWSGRLGLLFVRLGKCPDFILEQTAIVPNGLRGERVKGIKDAGLHKRRPCHQALAQALRPPIPFPGIHSPKKGLQPDAQQLLLCVSHQRIML